MNFLLGIKNFLELVENNWTTIIVILGLCIELVRKLKNWLSKSDEEKINIAKAQIKENMLKYITDAELEYLDMSSAGKIKRSQVIKQIYTDYPILSKIVDQETLSKWIDEEINSSLKDLRDILKTSSSTETVD